MTPTLEQLKARAFELIMELKEKDAELALLLEAIKNYDITPRDDTK